MEKDNSIKIYDEIILSTFKLCMQSVILLVLDVVTFRQIGP